MHGNRFVRTLSVEGALLILISLTAYATIGSKSSNMMMAGIALGIAMWICAWYASSNNMMVWAGVGLSLTGAVIFTQRAVANFLYVIGIVQHETKYDAYNKTIMVVLLLMNAFVCLTSLIILYTYLPEKKA